MADEVFASLPLAVVAFGTSKGIDFSELMAAGGLRPEELSDRDATVPYECLPLMWELIIGRFPEDPLGIEYADTLDYTAGGVVGYVVKHARTIGEALDTYTRFSRLLDPRLVLGVEQIGAVHRASIDHEARVVAMPPLMEMMVITFVRFTEQFTGTQLPLQEVCFRHPQRHPTAMYEEVFGNVNIRFGAAYTGVTVPGAVLDLPFKDADPSIRRYLEAHAENLLSDIVAHESPQPVDVRVREHIDSFLLSGRADMEHVAKAMAMSTRSLQRALQGLSTNFREQLDEVRRQRSLQLLRQEALSVQEIAFMLGYADPRNFYRSFKRWTATTPTAYRRAH